MRVCRIGQKQCTLIRCLACINYNFRQIRAKFDRFIISIVDRVSVAVVEQFSAVVGVHIAGDVETLFAFVVGQDQRISFPKV
ncbi:MAG: hypothetical protein IPQ10_14605 [Saprospiraceae bacterium]|nr:hypothetical protein [Saprospiraceae bacterium]